MNPHNSFFNHHDNAYINYRMRSRTMQPIRSDALSTLPKEFLLGKYFDSQKDTVAETSERAKYVNVRLIDQDETLLMQQAHHHPQQTTRNHQHVHTRSHSQHYYHTMYHQVNDRNNYYNLSQVGTTIIPARSGHLPPQMDEQTPPTAHNVAPLAGLKILQVCNELGNMDSPPPMPSPRNYTISSSKGCGLFKITLPQRRFIKGQFTDPVNGISLMPGTPITVLGTSKEDRSKFSVCYYAHHIDLPHQLTHAPQPNTNNSHWNPH